MKKICLISIFMILIVINFTAELVEKKYNEKLNNWIMTGYKNTAGVEYTPTVSNVILEKNKEINFEAYIPATGFYNIEINYSVLSDTLEENEIGIKINDEFQYYESRRIILPQFWTSDTNEFSKDRYGDEVIPQQKKIKNSENSCVLKDAAGYEEEPLKFLFKEGKNNINIRLFSGNIKIVSIKIFSPQNIDNYEQYIKNHEYKNNKPYIKIIEAEKPDYKNDTSVNPVSSRDLEVYPYSTDNLLLNTLGKDSWEKAGQKVIYTFSVPETGYYKIAYYYLQNSKSNSLVYRSIDLDGKTLFDEMKKVTFEYTNNWKMYEPDYMFYLEKGEHYLSLEVNVSVYGDIINGIYRLTDEINSLALDLKKLTGGNSVNKNTEWDILNYFPDISDNLMNYENELKKLYDKALELNKGKNNSQELISLKSAIKNIEYLYREPDLIPKRYSLLNEGSNSIVKDLSTALTEFEKQPLQLDRIFIYNDKNLIPEINISFLKRFTEGIKRFFNSFYNKNKKANNDEKVITVWVNRARSYVNLLQRLSDKEFTAKTGIKVEFSIMPDEQKLILANASETSPDIALGISNWLPFELGIRGAALNLRQFSDFGNFINNFSPGALLPYIYEENCYALPETQDFYVLFYRKDIFDKLNIPIPDTWDDVINILPELQRYGMNFYLPISGASGFKPLATTTPFLYQYDGSLYSDNGLSTAIDSRKDLEGIELMTKLYTLYGIQLQVPNFFEHFRSGLSPIGISNFTTYVQLNVGAPELKNSWGIALAPGVKDKTGNIQRWQSGSAQSSMIFSDTQYPEESWEFIKWWLSEDTQTEFGNQIQTLYGKEFMWNSSNIKAFSKMPIPDTDKEIIINQWEWLRESPKTPAGYMVERELSNIWVKIVLEGKNTRAAIDDSVNKINKEMIRKLEEFGYIKDGEIIRNYYIPKIDDVIKWRNVYEE